MLRRIIFAILLIGAIIGFSLSGFAQTTPTWQQVINAGNKAYKPAYYNGNYHNGVTQYWLTDKKYVDSIIPILSPTGVTSWTFTNGNGFTGYVTNPTTTPTFSLAALTQSQIYTALTYTPYNNTNPNSYIPLTALSATSPLFYNNSTGTFTIQPSSTSQAGALSSTDWNTFNNKANSVTGGYLPLSGGISFPMTGSIYYPSLKGNFIRISANDSSGILFQNKSGVSRIYLQSWLNGTSNRILLNGKSGISYGSLGILNNTVLSQDSGNLIMSSTYNYFSGISYDSTTAMDMVRHNLKSFTIPYKKLNDSLYASSSVHSYSITANAPLTATNGVNTGTVSIPAATNSVNGYLTSTDWNTFNNKQPTLTAGSNITITSNTISATVPTAYVSTLTTTGTSGAASVTTGTLNVPRYDNATTLTSLTTATALASVGTLTTGVWNATPITNANLANSTISGVSLGSNLNSNTPAYGISGTAFNGSAAVSNWKVDTTSIASKLYVTAKTAQFITGNQSITFTPSASGDVTGSASGATTLTPTLVIGAGKVTNAQLAGSIANSKLSNSTISGIALGTNLDTLKTGYGLSGTLFNGGVNQTWKADTTSLASKLYVNAKTGLTTFTINGTGMALGTSSTVTAAAGTLTGATLASGVTASSITTASLSAHTAGYGLSGSSYNGNTAQAWTADSTVLASKPYITAKLAGKQNSLSVTAPITLTTNTLALTSTGTNSVVLSTGATLTTPTLGVASATSLAITGAGGAGFVSLTTQTATPSAPSAGTRLFSNSNNKLSWTGSANNYVKTFDGSVLTADRVFSLPNRNAMIDSLTTSTSTALNGVIQGNGSVLSSIASTFTINGTGMALGTSSTVTAAAGTLTGTALNSTVVTSSLTTVGTLTTGTWNATKIGLAYGGTNSDLSASGAVGDIIQASSSTAFQRLAAGAVGTILRSTGTASLTAYTTATYPNTATSGYLMFATGTNAFGENSRLVWNTSNGLNVSNVAGGTNATITSTCQTTTGANIYGSFYGQTTNTIAGIRNQMRLEAGSTTAPVNGMGQAIYFTLINHAQTAFIPANKISSSWYSTGSNINKSKISLWAQDATDANTDNLVEMLSVSQNGTYLGTQTNTTVATANLHIAAGTASANTSPLKFTSGTNLTSAEPGTVEYDGTNIFTTPNTTIGRWPLSNNSVQYTTPVTTNTVTATAQVNQLVCNPAGTLAALTITFPPSPVNGQTFGFGISQIITVLTLAAGTGGATINGTVLTNATNSSANFVYCSTPNAWFQIQ